VLSNLPVDVTESDLTDLTERHGEISRIILESPMSSPPTALIEFIDCADAALAARSLDKREYRTKVLTAGLQLHGLSRCEENTSLSSRTVKISWSAPSVTGWAYYPTVSQAKEQANVLQGVKFGGRKASVSYISPRKRQTHSFPVEIKGLPLNVTIEDIRGVCHGTSSANVSCRPNYERDSSILEVRSLLTPYEPINSFHVLPASASKVKIIAFATFGSAETAATAVNDLHHEMQVFLKNNALLVEQVYLAKYDITPSHFTILEDDIDRFRQAHDKECKIRVGDKPEIGQPINPIAIHIEGTDPKAVAHAKKALDNLLRGEPLPDVWDEHFDTPDGASFFANFNADTRFFARYDRRERTVHYFSRNFPIEDARNLILRQLGLVHARRHIISIGRDVVHPLLTNRLRNLRDDHGIDATLDISARTVTVESDSRNDVKRVKRVLAELSSTSLATLSQDGTISDGQCIICNCPDSWLVDLPCRHAYCEMCLRHILRSSAGPHFSPLRCIAEKNTGGSGSTLLCNAGIPCSLIHELLSTEETKKLLEFSLLSHLGQHLDEFRFCPTADCPVVYCPGSSGIVLQCPSCQKRICPSCHVEFHEGLNCVDYQDA